MSNESEQAPEISELVKQWVFERWGVAGLVAFFPIEYRGPGLVCVDFVITGQVAPHRIRVGKDVVCTQRPNPNRRRHDHVDALD